MTTSASITSQKGGAWLIEKTLDVVVCTPERMTEEQRLILQTAREFVTNEVISQTDQLETKDWNLARRLLKKCGELGLLGTDVPEEYGGLLLDKVSSIIIAVQFGQARSFNALFGSQTGLVILPIRAFGTNIQKTRYLPRLVGGEWVGAYCLSESGAGSDALSLKSHATRLEDGSFVINGEKMWITNGGFADLFIVFAKVDGEHLTAFVVERAMDGVSSGKEEQKMGLLGSSTTPVTLQDVKVPAENLLGEIGKGHKVAFNVLNYGRLKLGASTVGGAQDAIEESARYAGQRRQFGQPISEFGAIKHKLGEMTVRTYAIESMVYRTAGLIDAAIQNENKNKSKDHNGTDTRLLAALEEYVIESSIVKIAGSETLDYVLDENVQIHGGNGYVRDYPAERHYRDARVNRIFEGTNEINRLIIPKIMAKRVPMENIPLIETSKTRQRDVITPETSRRSQNGPLSAQEEAVRMFKKISLSVLGLATRTYGEKLSNQQELLSLVADIMIDTFGSESVVLRASQAAETAGKNAKLQADAARVFVNDATARIEFAGRSALAAMTEGDVLHTYLAVLKQLLESTPINTVAIRRRLADSTVEQVGYIF